MPNNHRGDFIPAPYRSTPRIAQAMAMHINRLSGVHPADPIAYNKNETQNIINDYRSSRNVFGAKGEWTKTSTVPEILSDTVAQRNSEPAKKYAKMYNDTMPPTNYGG